MMDPTGWLVVLVSVGLVAYGIGLIRFTLKAKKLLKAKSKGTDTLVDQYSLQLKINQDLRAEIQEKDAYIRRLQDAVYGKQYPGVEVIETNF